jgi:hypothetical protein
MRLTLICMSSIRIPSAAARLRSSRYDRVTAANASGSELRPSKVSRNVSSSTSGNSAEILVFGEMVQENRLHSVENHLALFSA